MLAEPSHSPEHGARRGAPHGYRLLPAADLDALERQASTDPLTGVLNRGAFMHHLGVALHRVRRRGGHVALILVDLDRFKQVNDDHGHLVGDGVLVAMADRLRGVMRPTDVLGRLGGDEFAVLVEGVEGGAEAQALGARIVDAARPPVQIGSARFACSTSVGLAITSDERRPLEVLLAEADLALYHAKARGRDRVELFDDDLRVRQAGRLGTEQMLRRAIGMGWLRIAYQPTVELRTGRTVAAEALLRVRDPGGTGLLAAASFIDVARSSGLLVVIDTWMIDRVVRQAAVWSRRLAGSGFGGIAVNVTARHLDDPGFAAAVLADLERCRLGADAIQFEVTEADLVGASPAALATLAMLRAAGIAIGLDNYGSGVTSLTLLRSAPLDYVKLDRSIVAEVTDGGGGRAAAASIIGLAHALGMRVVAEGVESAAEVRCLVELGCDRAQGFYFATGESRQAITRRVLNDRRAG